MDDLEPGPPPPKPSLMTRAHWKLVVFCIGVLCFALLLGGGAVYSPATPTPRLTLASRWCNTSSDSYTYFSPFEWADRKCNTSSLHHRRQVFAATNVLKNVVPCRVCHSCSETACVPPSYALAADSASVLGMMVASKCAQLRRLSLDDAYNVTLYASTFGHWTHISPPKVVAATLLNMVGYNGSHVCPEPPSSWLWF